MKKRYSLAIISFVLFVIITIFVVTNNIAWLDNPIYNGILLIRCKPLDFFFKTITHIGDTIPATCIIMALLVLIKKQKDRRLLGITAIITLLSNQALKYLIARPRPPLEERLVRQGGYSYPSGHTMISLCIYGVLIYFIQTKEKNKKKKTIYTILLSLLIVLIGISRIYVRVHWPSDVLGGFFLSLAILIGCIEWNQYKNKGERK